VFIRIELHVTGMEADPHKLCL